MTFVDESAENGQREGTGNNSQWGYDMYPERRQRPSTNTGVVSKLFSPKGRDNLEKIKCERNVYRCFKESPLVKLMLGALKSAGCPVDIRRHIACEECAPNVSGGYDPVLNQVVICHNTVKKSGLMQGVLMHEMIHMFDYCQNKLDFKNLDHLACTEIRAANLAHCSFMSAWMAGDTSIFNFKQSHQTCVKNKALSSILAARNVTEEEGMRAIERVFTKCYNDLEPVGKRLRRNSDDINKVYRDGFYYGYEL
ncbi:mitochondrial inner membrane protease ATP23 homolog [Cylas formicarius]|uniref:mitochondrial inner membrane protease ATP23 homolog n=1 Tax=Cylas formicarius TaxID=197179 RepID=UPI00295886AD|nr:mitochondrial inner membrane protease ATP23 homolog [Cylas formicarius]